MPILSVSARELPYGAPGEGKSDQDAQDARRSFSATAQKANAKLGVGGV